MLDDFHRANGPLGGNWSGNTSGYAIASNQLDVGTGGYILWSAANFGANQEAYVTLATVDTDGSEQDLLLKSQSSSGYGSGVIEVLYDAANGRVQVWTYTSAQSWVQRGADISATFSNGDQLGARATAAGQVKVFKNGSLLATRDVTAWPYYADGGYIGLWLVGAGDAVLDDFGGGTAAQGQIKPPDSGLALSPPGADPAFRLAGWTVPPGWRTASDGPALPAAKLPERAFPVLFDEVLPSTTITYTYDGLYRLTDAVYSDGQEFHYTYDPVGNRLSERKCFSPEDCVTTNYAYDAANRLTSAGTVTYTWDNNGNLLSDGTATYGYDAANRLTSVSQGGHTYAYTYGGNNDRLTQSVDSVVTRYTLDLNAGLTQVLSDGTNTYLYGLSRIGELQPGGFLYHLGDSLGSVRQLVHTSGEVKLAQSYEPYGAVMASAGNAASAYGYTGQQQSGDLIYLRARSYDSQQGRFLTRDTSTGDQKQPMSYNRWLYSDANPINLTDPSGKDPLYCEYIPLRARVTMPECQNTLPAAYVAPKCSTEGCGSSQGELEELVDVPLTPGGTAARTTYFDFVQTPGWWNDYTADSISPGRAVHCEAKHFSLKGFVGLWIIHEANRVGKIADILTTLIAQDLYAGGWNPAYCSIGLCYNGVFNFMAAESQLRGGLFGGPNDQSNSMLIKFHPQVGPESKARDWMNKLGTTALDFRSVIIWDQHKGPSTWGNVNDWGSKLANVYHITPDKFGLARNTVYYYVNNAIYYSVDQFNYWKDQGVDMTMAKSGETLP